MEIRVCNIRNTRTGEYIGRPSRDRAGSPLANLFYIGEDGDRQEVIAKFRTWLWGKITAGDKMVLAEGERLLALAKRPGGVNLLCFCAPLACHGDVIKSWLEWVDKGGTP